MITGRGLVLTGVDLHLLHWLVMFAEVHLLFVLHADAVLSFLCRLDSYVVLVADISNTHTTCRIALFI